jgi:hypothetical protein
MKFDMKMTTTAAATTATVKMTLIWNIFTNERKK